MMGMLLGGMPQPKTPKWLRGKRVIAIARGKETWWGMSTIIVRGAPPEGTVVMGADSMAADWGPVGTPTQIRAEERIAGGLIAMRDRAGGSVCFMANRDYNLILDQTALPVLFLYYPKDANGEGQPIVACERIPDTERQSMDSEYGLPGVLRLRPIAFVSGYGEPTNIWLDQQEMEMVPIMSGVPDKQVTEAEVGFPWE